MKNIFIVLIIFLLLGACESKKEHSAEECATNVLPPKDSLFSLADEVVEYVIGREVKKEHHIDSLRKELKTNKSLTTEQILQMEREMRSTRKQQHLYSEELNAYKEKRIIKRDSIVYNIKKVERVDTVVITVYDTVVVTVNKKLCKQHIRNQNRRRNE